MQTLMNKTLFVVLVGFSLMGSSMANAYGYQPYPMPYPQQPYYGQSGTLYRTTHTTTTTYYGYPQYGYGYPGQNPYGGSCGYGYYGGSCGAYPYPQYVYGGGCFYGMCGGGWGSSWGGCGWGGACGGYPKSSWGFFVNIGGISFGGGARYFY